MRILMFADRFPPEVRSAAHLFHDLAREFQRRGHEVAVITKAPRRYVANGQSGKAVAGWEVVGGVPALRVRGLPLTSLHPIVRALDHLALGWSFWRASMAWPLADVLLVYTPPLPLAQAGARYHRLLGTPLILNVQDVYPQTAIDLGLLRNRAAIALAERMERQAYERAARVVVHSPGNRVFLQDRKGVPGEKVQVIYNWVDLEALRPGHLENGFRSENGLSGRFVVSYAGVMGYAQDLTDLIECAARLQADSNIVFLIVGEGVREARWKGLVAERALPNVRFLPMQPRERYAQILAASDVCLVPLDAALRTPVVPGKLQSIMACGRPAITIVHPGGDTPKLVEESGGGINVPPGEPHTLAEVIRRLKADPASRERMGRRARAFAEVHFSIDLSADAYEAIFAEVLRERSRRAGSA